MQEKNIFFEICNWCGQTTQIIYVHGHGQCSVCGINIDECCRGENISCSIEPDKNSESESAQ